jgi:hypothetical protein
MNKNILTIEYSLMNLKFKFYMSCIQKRIDPYLPRLHLMIVIQQFFYYTSLNNHDTI